MFPICDRFVLRWTQNCYIKFFIHLFIEESKLNICSELFSIKDNETESNAFSKSINTKRPGIKCVSVNSIMSYTKRMFSSMHLPFIKPI